MLTRTMKWVAIGVVAALAAGCCVLPPHGWGHGPRGHGYYRDAPPDHGYRHRDDDRRYPDRDRREWGR